MAYPNPLIFKNAEIARDAITKRQKREIAKMYSDWSDEIWEMQSTLVRSKNISSELTWYQLDDLRAQLREQSNRIMREADGLIRRNIYIVSNEVLKSNIDLLKAAGITNVDKFAMAFSNVPSNIVEKLVTGQIYDTGWSLSKSIWGAHEKVLQEAYGIVAKGVATNQSISEMAKSLSAYVDPKHRKPWNLTMKDGVKIYPRQVDYAAQRLARTLVQHSYQQSFVELTENNPFVKEYVWIANGSRACELCIERDGVHFKKDMLPLDHPNGMCTMVPVISETMVEDLNKWLSSDDGDMPEIDKFAKNFGYEPSVMNKNDWYKTPPSNGKTGILSQARSTKAMNDIEAIRNKLTK